jgi:hypothetical protein
LRKREEKTESERLYTRHGGRRTLLAVVALTLSISAASAQESYSPHVDRTYPTNVYWGDTHVHTTLSGDAYAFGARLTPAEAYRFASGETVRADNGRTTVGRPVFVGPWIS